MTNIRLDPICERDADFVIMREFCTNHSFALLFLKQIGIEECKIVSIDHSVMDATLGESDIEIHIENEDIKICLMIENKINAGERPKQYERYMERGAEKVYRGEIDGYHVFMTAPKAYFSETNQYNKRVTYEEMLEVMTDTFSVATIKKALEKKDAYQPIVNKDVSDFWSELYKYAERNYNDVYELMLTKTDRGRAAKALWPGSRTNVDKTKIQWKSDRGFVDLQLDEMADYIQQVKQMLTETIGEYTYKVVQTSKSASIRKKVSPIVFRKSFGMQRNEVGEALNAVSEMYDLAQNICEGIQCIREGRQSPLLQHAIAIATDAHKGQKDKAGADYIGHPLRVMERLNGEKEKIVAVLHDTIEDTFVTPAYLLEQGFSQEIVDGVLAVTRQENETYEDFVHRASLNPIGRAVKLADLEDNMDIRRLCCPMNEWDFERLNKYLKAYKYLQTC